MCGYRKNGSALVLLALLLVSVVGIPWGEAQLAVSANDNKLELVNGVSTVVQNPPPDTVSVIDLDALVLQRHQRRRRRQMHQAPGDQRRVQGGRERDAELHGAQPYCPSRGRLESVIFLKPALEISASTRAIAS